MDLKFKLLENLFGFFCLQNIFVCRRLLWSNFFVKNFFVENVVDFGKFPLSNFLWKISLNVENLLDQIFYEKFLWLWKISLIKYFLENLLDQIFLWKISMINENFLDCGKIFWWRKFLLTVENLLSWLQI